jgi:hypothetical protein
MNRVGHATTTDSSGFRGRYSIVMALNTTVPWRCGHYDPEREMFLAFQNPEADGVTTLAVLIRQLVSARTAVGTVGQTFEDAYVASANDTALRVKAPFLKGTLGEYYPEIEVWKCDATTGVATYLGGHGR